VLVYNTARTQHYIKLAVTTIISPAGFQIRPLPTILRRIAFREQRLQKLKQENIPLAVADFELDVLNSLKREYLHRVARLSLFLGLTDTPHLIG
jgi:hypothetical protein